MSYLESNRRFDYIVTANEFADLTTIYDELESLNKVPENTTIDRKVVCKDRRPSSRNTIYSLTHGEALELRNNSKIKSVSLHPKYLGVKAGTCEELSSSTQTSTAWDKSSNTTSQMKNWGLLRVVEGHDTANWGSNGSTQSRTGTIQLGQSGRNVDVVVTDADGILPSHPEYQRNVDGTGGSRVHQINWCQWNPEVTGGAVTNYTYNFSGIEDHPLHVQGTVGGNTQGWARDVNLYNIYYDASPNFNNYSDFGYVMDYIRAFHRHKEINTETGRKNPTISTNSWGQSIFPGEYSFGDITAVTYRGVRHEPVTSVSYYGVYGVCSNSSLLATFEKKENASYNIVTFGDLSSTPPTITDVPSTWVTVSQSQATYEIADIPGSASYTLTFSGPCQVSVLANIAVLSDINNFDIGVTVSIYEGETLLQQETKTATVDYFYGDAEVLIASTYNLTGAGPYTITFESITPPDEFSTYNTLFDLHVSSPGSFTANTTEIPNQLVATSTMTAPVLSIYGDADDGYAIIPIPFTITYLGNNYVQAFLGTNGYLTFGNGSSQYYSLGYSTPPYPKIMWGSGDRRLTQVFVATTGSAPNREFRLHVGMASTYTSSVTNMQMQYVFYENNPSHIDVHFGQNGTRYANGGFTNEQLHAWGLLEGKRIPMRVPGLDADIEDAQKEGIIFVGAAGNGAWKHDVPGGLDWDNTFEMGIRYPGSVTNPYYYMRGSSPTAVESKAEGGDYDLNTICVGATDVTVGDYKAYYSDCGPGVDLYAPGTNIMSCLANGVVVDPRSNQYGLGKFSGTSMATPQVTGVLAGILEIYPHMNQVEAKHYLLSIAKHGQMSETHGGTTDTTDLQGSVNLHLYYKNEIQSSGQVYPRYLHHLPPEQGQIYPRVNRRRR